MDTDGTTIIEHYGTLEAAESQASYLVERGIGGTIEPDATTGSFSLVVLADDAGRAREMLGLTQVEPLTGAEVDLRKVNRPWLIPVVLIALGMMAIPILAFLITFKLTAG